MNIYNVENLSVVQERRQNEAMIPVSLGTLGQQLVQERLKSAQTTQLVSALGQELVKAKLEIANLKGGNV
jgi:hypothetical protein